MATMRKTEDHHHSYEAVVEYVNTAKRVILETALTPEQEIALLPTLITLLSAKQVFYEQAAPLPAFDLNQLRGAK